MEKLTIGLCPYCGVGCRFYIKTLNGEPVGIEVYEGGVNGGKLCPKGVAALDFLRHRDRLTRPLKRTEKGFVEISWEQAIREIAGKILEIRDKYGPDALGFLSSARCSNEENYLMQKMARLLGTNNVDHCARLCHASTVAGLSRTVGAAAQSGSYRDIPRAKVLLIWGYNPAETHPVLMHYILKAKDNGARIIVVDPRKTRTAWFADMHLRIRPGTDIALANALMHVIIKERLYDRDFVSSRTKGFEELVRVVEKYKPEYAEKITGVPAHLIRETAITFATAGRGIIMWAMGITQHVTGTGNVEALADLGLLCGYVGKEGTGLFPMRGQNNVQGACDMGALPDVLPGYQSVTDSGRVAGIWGVEELPEKPGLTVPEMIKEAHKGNIKALYVMGENPAVSDPNTKHVIEALENLELLVVQDIFLTETAEHAHYVLPAAAYAEKEGSFTASERRVQWNFKAIEPPGEAKADWEILVMLGKALGLDFNYESVEDVTREICLVVPQYRGITPERLKGNVEGIQWPCPSEDHPGTERLHVERFPTPDGRANLIPVEFRPPAELPDEDYPFMLTTVRVVGQYHTATMSGRSEALARRWGEAYAEINPSDAKRLGIEDGERIRIVTRRGSYECRARITKRVGEGLIAVPWHWGANVLTNDALDPVAKIPELKVSACRVERVM
ncbi:formate dehydrogenase subunit alpha [Thermococcus sp. P6]|uniref:formate dehydrogenase subunit alpha n=1 Tax=Thermococcus sp. P6 TaxID=122420 RepID=UPI000B61F980|nr:formate dehydrogenase subunit alpha [Thermococcus sp. P6]ASJ10028.1 formate dehydrogenase subunit alpha [Thermococcus sp. P6]